MAAKLIILTAKTWREGEADLCLADPVMARLIAAHPPYRQKPKETPFQVLATSIINQQLSQKAADAIEARVVALTAQFNPAASLRIKQEKLRLAGLSRNKAEFLHTLAKEALAGNLEEKELRKLTDEEVIARLTTIRGIGRWTAEMFLMFALRRPDVLSLGDAGLRRAARNLYGKRFSGDDSEVLKKAGKRWHPWRTIACRHLWLSL